MTSTVASLLFSFSCDICSKVFMQKKKLVRHMQTHDKPCRICNLQCNSLQERNIHEKMCRRKIRSHHFDNDYEEALLQCESSAINDRFKIFHVEPENDADYQLGIAKSLVNIKRLITELLKRYSALKFYLVFEAELKKDVLGTTQEYGFHSNTVIVLQDSDLDVLLKTCENKLITTIEEFNAHGSGYILESFTNICIHVTEYRPCAGGTFLELPESLRSKRCLLNIRNKDNECVKWCLLAAKFPQKRNSNSTSAYKKHLGAINLDGVNFPTSVQDIPKVEVNNNLRINVYGFDEDLEQSKDSMLNTGVFPRYISPYNYETTVNLLLISHECKQHFVLIKSLNALIRTKNKYLKTVHCERCLQGFSTKYLLEKHMIDCIKFSIQRTRMPKEKRLKFTNTKNLLEYPVYIVCDFEAILRPVQGRPVNGKTTILSKHECCGYAYKVISTILPELTKATKVERHENCIDTFISDIYQEYEEIKHIFQDPVPIAMSHENQQHHQSATHCHVCEQLLTPLDKDNYTVKDHCHFTGQYRGAAHNCCNLHLAIPTKIPIVFHGLKNYDGHFIIKALAKFVDDISEITVIPQNIQKFTAIFTKEFIFWDSQSHLFSSLDNLVKNLRDKGEEHFKNLISEFPDPEDRLYLFKKGLFPYNYATTFEHFDDPIPEYNEFYNDLTNTLPSIDDYNNLLVTCNRLGIRTLGELHDHYVKLDVILLTDVVQAYREMALKEYKLDVFHYSTAPAYSFDAMLKMTGAEPEMLSDPTMYLFMEQGIRGGLAVISERLLSANNPEFADYNPTKDASAIFYTDCSNLYGKAMSEKLPYNGFKWMSQEEIDQFDISTFNVNRNVGLILEVDLAYPEHLHDLHSDYPLAPDHLTITRDMLSPTAKQFLIDNGVNFTKHTRLAPNLYDKCNYIVHVKTLQLYLSLGMVLKKIHRGVIFRQKAWLKPYIDFNTIKRQLAVSDQEKDFFKLLINCIFGKNMENVRLYRNVKMIQNGRQHALYTSKPQFKRFEIISPTLVAAELIKPEVILNKPIYCGLAILDLSKYHMFDFHYNCIKKTFKGARLAFTDTDSLLYTLKTDNLSRELGKIKSKMDFSNYPHNHRLYNTSRKNIPGFFKDEMKSISIKQFCGLHAKCYSILSSENKQKLATAGVRSAVHNELTHQRFVDVLVNNNYYNISQKTILSKNHQPYTIETKRIGISALDTKRYLLDDYVRTLPYGHYKIV